MAPTTPALHPVADRPSAESRRPLLAIRLRGPGREWSVLGADDARGIVAEGFTATADRGGPVTCAFNLRRDPTVVYPDLGAFSELDAEIGNQLVFGGRVWELPGTRGTERSLSVSARGWQSHLEDDVVRRSWVHARLGDYRDKRTASLTVNLLSWYGGADIVSARGATTIMLPNGTLVPNAGFAGIVLDLVTADARRVSIEWESSNTDGGTTFYCRGADDVDGLVGVTDAFTFTIATGTSGTTSGTFSANKRYVLLFLYTATGRTSTADDWIKLKTVRVFRSAGYESSGASVLRASTVVTDVLASGALPLLSTSTERIVQSGLIDAGTRGIPHFDTGGGYQSPRQVIDAANAYHGWNVGVDARKRLFFEPRADLPVCEVGEWSGAEFSDQSTASAETLYNRVIVQGQDAAGSPVNVIRTATVPALDLMGVTRTMVLAVGAVLNTASAEAIGDAWLSEKARSQFKGSLRVVGMGSVRDLATGRPMHPSELLRLTGQMIRISHLIDPDTGGQGRDAIIAQVQYAHDDESASISLDNENGRLDALLARVGALQAVNA